MAAGVLGAVHSLTCLLLRLATELGNDGSAVLITSMLWMAGLAVLVVQLARRVRAAARGRESRLLLAPRAVHLALFALPALAGNLMAVATLFLPAGPFSVAALFVITAVNEFLHWQLRVKRFADG